MAQRPPLSQLINSPKTGKTSPSTSSTTWPPAPASASSTKTPKRTTPKSSTPTTRSPMPPSTHSLPRSTRAHQHGVPILVINTLAWPRNETIEIGVQLPDGLGRPHRSEDERSRFPRRTYEATRNPPSSHLAARVEGPSTRIYRSSRYRIDATLTLRGSHRDRLPPLHSLQRTSSKSRSIKTGCITSIPLTDTKPNICPKRLRQPAPNLRRHSQAIRRLEHRPRHPRRHHDPDRQGRFSRLIKRPSPQDRPHHSHLAKLPIHPGHLPRRRGRHHRSSTTTSTGTKPTSSSKPPSL